jgi:hypothetical protein
MPIEPPKFSTATWKQWLFAVCFLTASGVAMLGWLAGLSWLAFSLVRLAL